MSRVEATLLARIADRPQEAEPRAVYIDWLESQGDDRARFLHCDNAFAAAPHDDDRWDALARESAFHDPAWTKQVARAYDVSLRSMVLERRILTVKAVRWVNGGDLRGAIRTVTTLPQPLVTRMDGASAGAVQRIIAAHAHRQPKVATIAPLRPVSGLGQSLTTPFRFRFKWPWSRSGPPLSDPLSAPLDPQLAEEHLATQQGPRRRVWQALLEGEGAAIQDSLNEIRQLETTTNFGHMALLFWSLHRATGGQLELPQFVSTTRSSC